MKSTFKTRFSHYLLSNNFNDKFWRSHLHILKLKIGSKCFSSSPIVDIQKHMNGWTWSFSLRFTQLCLEWPYHSRDTHDHKATNICVCVSPKLHPNLFITHYNLILILSIYLVWKQAKYYGPHALLTMNIEANHKDKWPYKTYLRWGKIILFVPKHECMIVHRGIVCFVTLEGLITHKSMDDMLTGSMNNIGIPSWTSSLSKYAIIIVIYNIS